MTYRLIENFDGDVTETPYASLGLARRALAQAQSDLVAEGFVCRVAQVDYTSLVCQERGECASYLQTDGRPLVIVHLAIRRDA